MSEIEEEEVESKKDNFPRIFFIFETENNILGEYNLSIIPENEYELIEPAYIDEEEYKLIGACVKLKSNESKKKKMIETTIIITYKGINYYSESFIFFTNKPKFYYNIQFFNKNEIFPLSYVYIGKQYKLFEYCISIYYDNENNLILEKLINDGIDYLYSKENIYDFQFLILLIIGLSNIKKTNRLKDLIQIFILKKNDGDLSLSLENDDIQNVVLFLSDNEKNLLLNEEPTFIKGYLKLILTIIKDDDNAILNFINFSEYKEEIFKIFVEEKKKFSNELINIFIKSVKNHQDLLILLKNQDIENFLLLIHNNIENIIKISENDINFETLEVPKLKGEENYSKLFKLYDEILKVQKEKKINKDLLSNLNYIWEKYIKRNAGNKDSLEQLLNEISFSNLSKKEKENWIQLINNQIYITGLNKLRNGEMSNKEILTFILKDDVTLYDNPEYLIVPRKFNINKIDDEVCVLFQKINWKEIYGINYKEFLNILFGQVDSIEKINNIIKLFDLDNDYKIIGINDILAREIFNLLIKFSSKISSKNVDEIYDIIKIILLISDIKNFENKNIFDTLENLPNDFSQKLFCKILNKIEDTNNITHKKIFNSLIKSFNQDSNNLYPFELLNKDDKKKQILNSISNLIIKSQDFFNTDINNPKILLLERFKQKKIFSNPEFEPTEYIRRTNIILSQIIYELENNQFTNNKGVLINEMNKKHILERRIKLLVSEDKFEYFLNNILAMIKQSILFKEKLTNIITYFENFFPNEKNDELNDYKYENNKYNEQKINYYLQIKHQLNVDKYIKEANHLNPLLKSKFFMKIYEKEKEKEKKKEYSDTDILSNALDIFSDLSYVLNDNFQEMNLLNEVLKSLNDHNQILKELFLMKEYFDKKDFTNEVAKSVEDKLIFLYEKENIKIALQNIIKFGEYFQVKKTDFSDKILEIKERLSKDINYFEIKDLIKEVKEIKIEYKNQVNWMNILSFIFEKENLMKFLFEKKEDDVRAITEFIDDVDSQFVKISDIQELIKCVNFIEDLKEYKKYEDLEFFEKYIEECNKDNNKKLDVIFNNINQKFYEIQVIFNQNLNRAELSKKIIIEIYKSSFFILKFNKNEYKTICNYNNKETDFIDILELRDKALLRKKETENDTFYNICFEFSSMVNKIQDIIDLLNKISAKGYPKDYDYIINIVNGTCTGGILSKPQKPINELLNNFKEILDEESELQKAFYSKYKLIRLCSGRQISKIYNYLLNNNKDITFLNKYLIDNNKFKLKNENKKLLIEKININDMFEEVNEYIENLYKITNLKYENLFEQSKIKTDNSPGIYFYCCQKDKIEKISISIFLTLTHNYPKIYNILLCNDKTSEEEIISFLYRAINSESNYLFMILKCENLNIQIGTFLINLLQELYDEKNYSIKSTLLFLYYDKASEVINQLRTIKKVSSYYFTNDLNKNINYTNKSIIEIVSSDASGVGKSNYIKDEFSLIKNYEYIYFPLGGDIQREEIISRLKKLNKKNVALHLDLLDINSPEIIECVKDFLYSFLVLKYYNENDDIFYYGNEIKIKIEIPFGFIDFFKRFPILEIFPQHILSKSKLPLLKISNEINSNCQIIVNYLNLLYQRQLRSRDLIIEGINSGLFIDSYYKEYAKVYSEEECRKIILEAFNKKNDLKNPTFYQINAFINILGDQLKCFSKDIYLTSEQLGLIEQAKSRNNLKILREFAVESFIDITRYFTKSAYDNLLNSQEITYESQEGKFNEEESIKQAINLLTQKEIVSFDKVKPSLIFINEDMQSISIITTCERNEPEYKNLKDLYNSGNTGSDFNLIDYKSLNRYSFIIEIQKLLSLDKYSIKDIENKIGSYVFTADNYIKTILILLRIRAKIPIIMMGETGCGKTSLIKMISKLKNNIMLIFKIHAGITNEDIIKFIEDNNLYQLDNKQNNYYEKIWIFLDEINTCNSMGLISEMMCKGSIEGKKLKDNVTFIAACNPYRRYEKKIEQIGLVSDKQKVRSLFILLILYLILYLILFLILVI